MNMSASMSGATKKGQSTVSGGNFDLLANVSAKRSALVFELWTHVLPEWRDGMERRLDYSAMQPKLPCTLPPMAR